MLNSFNKCRKKISSFNINYFEQVLVSNTSRCLHECIIDVKKKSTCICAVYEQGQPVFLLQQKVIFSGIQPTGIPHIGNYLGALKHWVNLQDEADSIYFSIVDLHAVTIPKDKNTMRSNILDMTACLLACGIDPNRSTLFLQSNIPEHAVLSWIIGCLVTVNRLKILPQWKEKIKLSKNVGYLGVFTYPVLQTADIILYKATDVPVGDDQLIHLQLTRDLILAVNKQLGENFFPAVNYFTTGKTGKIRSLKDPSVKMSKSAVNTQSRIELVDSDDEIRLKVRRSVTDCISEVTYDPDNRPGVSNLIEIHCGFSDITPDEACRSARGLDTGQYKKIVADSVIDTLSPIREKYLRIRKDESYLDSILDRGSNEARKVAVNTWKEVQHLMGMRK